MKDYWNQTRRLQKRINRKMNEINMLRQKAEGMNGIGTSDMPKSASPSNSKMENFIIKIIALEEEIKSTQAEYDELIAMMKKRIAEVNDADYRDILSKRYLEFKSWDTIADEMFICKRQAFYIHAKAVNSMK